MSTNNEMQPFGAQSMQAQRYWGAVQAGRDAALSFRRAETMMGYKAAAASAAQTLQRRCHPSVLETAFTEFSAALGDIYDVKLQRRGEDLYLHLTKADQHQRCGPGPFSKTACGSGSMLERLLSTRTLR